ncbi:response regulator [Burkholderia singularis]|nr:response regulator [Burkholderia singularis]
MQRNPLNIIVADDHPLFTLGVEALMNKSGLGRVSGQAENTDKLIDVLKASPCDLLITDYLMTGKLHGGGIRLLSYVRQAFPALPVVVLTMVNNAAVHRTIWQSGVSALVSKADLPSELPVAVQAAAAGRRYLSSVIRGVMTCERPVAMQTVPLSPRETQVLKLFAAGLSASEVADRLKRSIKTVSRHKRSGMDKLGVSTDGALFKYMNQYDDIDD